MRFLDSFVARNDKRNFMDEKWYTLALKYLQQRPRSEKEISDYLVKKKAPEELIGSIVEKLRQQRFLDDEEFARWWIDQRTRFKPKGKRLIMLELQQKGISKEIIASVYENANQEEIVPDTKKAITLLQKKKAKFENLQKKEQFNKAGAYLSRRGFDMESVLKSIDEVFGK